MKGKLFAFLLLFVTLSLVYSYTSFTGAEGEMMLDTNGVAIQAHGGQIQKLGNKYYWIGEDKTNDYKPCPGIHMYTSDDLYNWKDEGLVLKTMKTQSELKNDYFSALYGDLSDEEQYAIYEDLWMGEGGEGCVIERPKMLHNPKTGKYVIWFHADGTTVHMGVETHNTVGKFQNRVGVQVARYQPGVGIGTHLDGQHVTINTLHGGAEHTVSTVHGLLADDVARL